MRRACRPAVCTSVVASLLAALVVVPALYDSSAASLFVEERAFTGTNRCEIVVNRDGEKWAELWCQGTYSQGGTCNGRPGSTRLYERPHATCVNP
jgi:hypothetical protein